MALKPTGLAWAEALPVEAPRYVVITRVLLNPLKWSVGVDVQPVDGFLCVEYSYGPIQQRYFFPRHQGTRVKRS